MVHKYTYNYSYKYTPKYQYKRAAGQCKRTCWLERTSKTPSIGTRMSIRIRMSIVEVEEGLLVGEDIEDAVGGEEGEVVAWREHLLYKYYYY